FQAEDGIRDDLVTGVQTCALPILLCSTSGEKVNESPKGLNRIVGRKFGASARPIVTVPKPPDRDTLASREKKLSPLKRPGTPVRSEERRVGKEGSCGRAPGQCKGK